MKLLNALGRDAKGIFKWFVSPQGQAVIHAGELAVEIAVPAPQLIDIINIANKWMAEIVKTQVLSVAAGAESGSNAEKAAMAISAVLPDILDFATHNGLPVPTADKVAAANKALVDFLNALDGKG